MSYVSLIFSYFSISVIPSIVRPALVCPAQCWMTTAGYIQPFISDLSTRAVLAAWWTLSWSLRGRAGTGSRGTSSTTTTSSPPPLRTPHFTSGSLSSSSSRYGSNSILSQSLRPIFTFQAALFYVPRKIWKTCEGGLMASFGKISLIYLC